MFSVARVYFILKYFGASSVRILDGGLRKWLAEGRPTVSDSSQVRHGQADPNDNGNYSFSEADPSRVIKNVGEMHKIVGSLKS